jgi:hypothetical protein
MKKITYPLIAFAFVATAAQAQDYVVGQSDAQPQDSCPPTPLLRQRTPRLKQARPPEPQSPIPR